MYLYLPSQKNVVQLAAIVFVAMAMAVHWGVGQLNISVFTHYQMDRYVGQLVTNLINPRQKCPSIKHNCVWESMKPCQSNH